MAVAYHVLNSIIPKSGNYSRGTFGSVFLLDYCKLAIFLSDLTSECKIFFGFSSGSQAEICIQANKAMLYKKRINTDYKASKSVSELDPLREISQQCSDQRVP